MSGQRLSRFFWPAAAALLAVGLAGYPLAIAAAMALAALCVAQLAVLDGGRSSFAIQVHSAFLLLLALGFSPGLGFVHWNMLFGTLLYVATEYCILARCLALLPWNRTEPLTWRRVGRTFFSRPAGNILDGIAASGPPASDGSAATAGGLAAMLALWRRRSRTRAALAGFDQRMLKDLGIGYYDARRESRKWFWQR
jgi:uncharacterized protein YjiS (DUF1127 family)